MFTRRQTCLEKAILAAVAVLLFSTAGQCAQLTTPALANSFLNTQLNDSSDEEPRVLRLHRSCTSEHDNYCSNGGKCMYPQDSDKPSCICTSSYSGPRCMFYSEPSRSLPELEQLIAIGFGVAIIIIILAIILYCFAYKRCIKSASLIKPTPSETSV
ncbi:hypothetical protein PAMA_018088 [Pampus argenteus]